MKKQYLPTTRLHSRWLRLRTALLSQEGMVSCLAITLAMIFSLTLPGFASIGNALTLARSVSVLGILGLGMAIVVIGRGLDLSLIAVMIASSASVMDFMNRGLPLPYALILGLILAMAIGFFNGCIIAFLEVPALFATLSSSFIIFGLCRYAFASQVIYPPVDAAGFLYFGQGHLLGIPMPIIVFLSALVVVHVFLSYTTPGRFIYARGDNPGAARLTGVDVRRDTIVSYMLSATIGFVAGIVSGATTASANLQVINSTQIFDVILVIVLGGVSLVGGRGGVLSLIAGTALIGILLNGLIIMNVNGQLQDIVRGLVLLTAIILDNRLHPRDEEVMRQGE